MTEGLNEKIVSHLEVPGWSLTEKGFTAFITSFVIVLYQNINHTDSFYYVHA